jgi:hypothetical protein
LLTLQEGVSENQFKEMTNAGVQLVVPAPVVSAYPKSIQPHLQTLESFIGRWFLLPAYAGFFQDNFCPCKPLHKEIDNPVFSLVLIPAGAENQYFPVIVLPVIFP